MTNDKEIVKIPTGEIGRLFLRFPPNTKKDDFLLTLEKLSNVGHGYWWWIADASMFAIHAYGEEITKEIATMVGCSEQHVNNLARLARIYPVRRRIPGLSITHHRTASYITSTSKRQKLLITAKEKRISTTKLYQMTRPREKRRVDFRFKVPISTANNKKFRKDLEAFFLRWKLSWWRSGTKKHTPARIEGNIRAVVTG